MRIDMLFNYVDNKVSSNMLMMSQDFIQNTSSDSNLPKDGGGFYKKGDALVLWNANEERNKTNSLSAVSLTFINFNKQVENS